MGKVISDPARVFDDGTKTGKNLLTDSQDCGIRLYLPVFGSRTLKMKVSPFLSPSGGDLGRQNALKPPIKRHFSGISSHYESEGSRFDSWWVHHSFNNLQRFRSF